MLCSDGTEWHVAAIVGGCLSCETIPSQLKWKLILEHYCTAHALPPTLTPGTSKFIPACRQ